MKKCNSKSKLAKSNWPLSKVKDQISFGLLLFVFGLIPSFSYSQVLTLDTVLYQIEQNNPMLRMYDEQINAVNNYSAGALSWMPPRISTGLWQHPYRTLNNGMWMITGEQMIPNPTKQKANYNYIRGMAPVEKQGREAKKNELFATAKENYYEWIVLQKKYTVAIQTDSLLDYIVRIAKLRYTYNKEKLNNIYKAEADLYAWRNMETMLTGDMQIKNVEINTLMNLDGSFVFTVDTTLHIEEYDVQLPDTALISSSRSDIIQLDASIDLVKLQQEMERSKRLPEFGVSFSHMQSLGAMPNQFSAMGMVTIPIVPWASREYKANIKGLDATANAIRYQKQSLINETSGMISSIQTQIKSTKNQYSNYTAQIIPALFHSYKASFVDYEQNTEDLFVVLDGLKMYSMARISQLDQLGALLKLQVEYEKQMEIR